MRALLLGLTTLACVFGHVTGQGKKMFCYYSSDARWRPYYGAFYPRDIDTNLCTHVIVAFAKVLPDGLGPNTPGDDAQWGHGALYKQCVNLKKRNPNLKVLLAVGGWKEGSEPFLPAIRDWSTMDTWAANAVTFLRRHGMDGMDMDWEFPGVRGSVPEDKPKFTQFMATIQAHFTRDAQETGREKMILTLATAAGTFFIENGYETTEIHKHVDYMLLMTYNYHGLWEKNVGHHSSITPSRVDEGERRNLCQKWTVDYWKSQGAPTEKLILGLATYGMSYTLLYPDQTWIGANATGGGKGGRMTREEGILAYFEICENLRNGWTKEMIPEQRSPYAYGDGQWVGYDDVESIAIKARYINQEDLAGAFIWSVEMDDFTGKGCSQGKYPLLSKISEIIRPGASQHSQTARPTRPPPPTRNPHWFQPTQGRTSPRFVPLTRPTQAPSTFLPAKKPATNGVDPGYTPCQNGRPFDRHPDCHMYYECTPWGAVFERTCGPFRAFDPIVACGHLTDDCEEGYY